MIRSKWLKDASRIQSELLWNACQSHRRLINYMPAKWLCGGSWAVNNFIHNIHVSVSGAREISRLLVGGQGSRGGDVSEALGVSVDNCCVWYLLRGEKAVACVFASRGVRLRRV